MSVQTHEDTLDFLWWESEMDPPEDQPPRLPPSRGGRQPGEDRPVHYVDLGALSGVLGFLLGNLGLVLLGVYGVLPVPV